MKIGILSDIHGNLPALKAVLAAFSRHRVSEVVCAGDLVGYYPFVNEVVEELRGIEAISIVGNHDHALIRGTDIPESFSATAAIRYARTAISPENLRYLSSLHSARCIRIAGVDIAIFHGTPADPLNGRFRSLDEFQSSRIRAGVAVGGHTHVPAWFRRGETVFINPGSCGQPRDFDIRASCAILDLDAMVVQFHREFYDIDAVYERMAELRFDPRIAWSLYAGEWVGGSTLSAASDFSRVPGLDRTFDLREYRYSLHLMHPGTSEGYNCYIQDGLARLVSVPRYMNGRNGRTLVEYGEERYKVKMNAVAAFKVLDDDLVLRPEHFEELDLLRRKLGDDDEHR